MGFHIARNPVYERAEARLRAREEEADAPGPRQDTPCATGAADVPIDVGKDDDEVDDVAINTMPRLVLRVLPSSRQLALPHIDVAQLSEQLAKNLYVTPVIRRLTAAHASRVTRR